MVECAVLSREDALMAVQWENDYDQALERVRRERKEILVDFSKRP